MGRETVEYVCLREFNVARKARSAWGRHQILAGRHIQQVSRTHKVFICFVTLYEYLLVHLFNKSLPECPCRGTIRRFDLWIPSILKHNNWSAIREDQSDAVISTTVFGTGWAGNEGGEMKILEIPIVGAYDESSTFISIVSPTKFMKLT